MIRHFLRILPIGIVTAFAAVAPAPLAAQEWTVLAGRGWVEHESSLGPGYHLNARRELAGWTDVRLPVDGGSIRIAALRFEADLLGQVGRSGQKVLSCAGEVGLCVSGADPVYLAGAGIAAKTEMTSPDRAVQLYFLPLTGSLYVLGARRYQEELAGGERVPHPVSTSLGGGVGNGAGLHVRLGTVTVAAEVRAILFRGVNGARAGALPLSVGLRW